MRHIDLDFAFWVTTNRAENSRHRIFNFYSLFFSPDWVEKTVVSGYTCADSEFPVAEWMVVGRIPAC
jgi:hypothetical protein